MLKAKETAPKENLLERLADRLGASANAVAIFAPPVERDGVTVIPVAKAKYVFGGGSGQHSKEEGSGGGGGVAVTPVGYIEIAEGVTHFRRIRNPLAVAACYAASGFAAWWLVKQLMRK